MNCSNTVERRPEATRDEWSTTQFQNKAPLMLNILITFISTFFWTFGEDECFVFVNPTVQEQMIEAIICNINVGQL